MSNFHPVEVVGRGSETQLQLGGNLNCIYYMCLALNPYNAKLIYLNFYRDPQPQVVENYLYLFNNINKILMPKQSFPITVIQSANKTD